MRGDLYSDFAPFNADIFMRGDIYYDLTPFNAVLLRRAILSYYDFTPFGASFFSRRLFVWDYFSFIIFTIFKFLTDSSQIWYASIFGQYLSIAANIFFKK